MRVFHFLMNFLPVHIFSQLVKCQSSFRWIIGCVRRWKSLISPSQKATLQGIQKLLASSKINSSSLLGRPDGMGCILRRRIGTIPLYAPGLRNRPSSTILLARLQDVAFLLPHPPGPSARTCLGVGREQPENKLIETIMCNQAAGLSRCLTRVQDAMSSQLKTLRLDKTKGKSSERMKQAVDELDYLVTFKWSIFQAMARTMQDLS